MVMVVLVLVVEMVGVFRGVVELVGIVVGGVMV